MFGIDVQPDANVLVGDFKRPQETAHHTESPFSLVSGTGNPIQLEQEASQGRSNEWPQWFVFVCFDGDSVVTIGFGQSLDFVEQYRFAHPAKSREQNAFLRSPLFNATEKDAGLFENEIPAHQFRRRRSSAGRKGVLDRVHLYLFIRIYI